MHTEWTIIDNITLNYKLLQITNTVYSKLLWYSNEIVQLNCIYYGIAIIIAIALLEYWNDDGDGDCVSLSVRR